MRFLEIILLASSAVAVQAKAIDKDETRIWLKRQFTPTNSTDGASCVKETVTETLRETVTVKDPVAVTVAASSADGDVNAKKFEGLRLSTITETETVVATELPETVTVQGVGSTVTQMLTVVAEALPVAFTVTEIVTEAVSAPIVTVTETMRIVGNDAAPVTITETVQGTCQPSAATTIQNAPIEQSSTTTPVGLPNGNGVGVSTVPIPESALPTTTFAIDPLAPSSQVEFPAFPVIPSSSLVATISPVVSSGVRSGPLSSTTAILTAPSSTVETPDASKPAATSPGDSESTGASSVANPPSTTAGTTEPASSELVEDTPLATESSLTTSSSASVTSNPVSATDAVSEPLSTKSSSANGATGTGTSSLDFTTTTPASSIEDTTATTLSSVRDTTTTIATSSLQGATTATSSTTAIITPPSPSIPTSAAASLNLGGVAPDTTAKIESAVSQDPDPQAIASGALIFPEINVSTLTFSSALELGNLMGLAVTPTPTPTMAAQAEVYPTQRVSSMTLKMLG